MILQDFIICVGTFILTIALIPTLLGSNKPKLLTSIPTAITLFIFALTFESLHLYLSGLSSMAGCVAWSILAWQEFSKGRIID